MAKRGVTFTKLFNVFRARAPHSDLASLYAELKEVSEELHELINKTKHAYSELLRTESEMRGRRRFFGVLPKKTKAIDAEVLPSIKHLINQTKGRMDRAEKTISRTPILTEEKERGIKVLNLLKKARREINSVRSPKTLEELDDVLRIVGKAFREFYEAEKYEYIIKRKVISKEIPSGLVNAFNAARRDSQHSVEVTRIDLENIWLMSKKLNKLGDQNNRVVWREWWTSRAPHPERDITFPKPHVNATIVMGGVKQNIHFVVN